MGVVRVRFFLLYPPISGIQDQSFVKYMYMNKFEELWKVWFTIWNVVCQSEHFRKVGRESIFIFYSVIFLLMFLSSELSLVLELSTEKARTENLSSKTVSSAPFVCSVDTTSDAWGLTPTKCTTWNYNLNNRICDLVIFVVSSDIVRSRFRASCLVRFVNQFLSK